MPVFNLAPARAHLDRMRLPVATLTTQTDMRATTQMLAERFNLTLTEAEAVLASLIAEEVAA